MNEAGSELLDVLASSGWKVKRRTKRVPLLPPNVLRRYSNVPAEVVAFLEDLEECTDPSDQIWAFTAEQYRCVEGPGFRWNECELMSLNAADADKDPRWRSRIEAFWDVHFPFMVAVHSDYDYLAIRLDPGGYGQVMHGYAPEFEEADKVADTFGEFLRMYARAIRTGQTKKLLAFLPPANAGR